MKIASFPAGGIALAQPVHTYFHQNHDGLRHAARLLGGYESMRLVDKIYEALQGDARISRRTLASVVQLLDLLRLENVGDPERPEMGFFAAIDPNDPAVEEICLLTDGLTAALSEWDAPQRRAYHDVGSGREAA